MQNATKNKLHIETRNQADPAHHFSCNIEKNTRKIHANVSEQKATTCHAFAIAARSKNCLPKVRVRFDKKHRKYLQQNERVCTELVISRFDVAKNYCCRTIS